MLPCYSDFMWRRLLCVTALLATHRVARAADADCATEAESGFDLRDSGQWRGAMRAFQACARESCPRVVRDDCRKGLIEIRAQGAHVVVHVRDEKGRDVVDARVTVDGAEIGNDERMNGILVDRGTHRVRAYHSGFLDAAEDVVVVAADKTRPVELVLRSSSPTSVPTVAGFGEQPAPPARTVPIVVGSVGLAAMVAFGVVGTWTYVDYRGLDACRPDCDPSRIDPLHRRAYVADALLGIGLVSLATATVLWFTTPQHRVGQSSASVQHR